MADLFDPPPPSPASAAGHRQRLRLRLIEGEALPDHELLELLLFSALPRRDTKPIARALLARFGTLAGVVAAPVRQLVTVQGLGEAGAASVRVAGIIAARVPRPESS